MFELPYAESVKDGPTICRGTVVVALIEPEVAVSVNV
jgi:hypothetical protein